MWLKSLSSIPGTQTIILMSYKRAPIIFILIQPLRGIIRSKFDAKLCSCFTKDTVILHFNALDHASQILCFLQIEGLWQACIQQIFPGLFSWKGQHLVLCISVSHCSNSYSISNFFIIIICYGHLF